MFVCVGQDDSLKVLIIVFILIQKKIGKKTQLQFRNVLLGNMEV